MKDLLIKITGLATEAHGSQQRKYTGDPYIVHPIAVAKLVKAWGGDWRQEAAGLLHDVVEDTSWTIEDVGNRLRDIGLNEEDVLDIVQLVSDLTDEYVKEKYPHLNRRARKALEHARLGRCSKRAQLIKACDIIDNTYSIVEHDPSFAKVYLMEKQDLVSHLTKIDSDLKNELV